MGQEEIKELRELFEKRIQALEDRLKKLEEQSTENVHLDLPTEIDFGSEAMTLELSEEAQGLSKPREELPEKKLSEGVSVETNDKKEEEALRHEKTEPLEFDSEERTKKVRSKSRKPKATVKKSEPWLPIIIQRTGPFGEALDACLKAYRHYHEQGKAPAFLLSLAGLVAIVLGMVYLLQESFQNYLSPSGKLMVVMGVGVCLVLGGLWMRKWKRQFEDFASAISGLGCLLFQLVIFFAGPYYGILSPKSCLLALFVVSSSTYFLAYSLNSRVLASTAFLGALLLPLSFPGGTWYEKLFFPYITAQAVVSVILSWRMRWRNLYIVSFAFSTAMIEWVSDDISALSLVQGVYIQIYFLFFALTSFFSILKRENFDLGFLTVHTANLVLFLLTSESFTFSSSILGVIFLAHGSLWVGLFLFSSKLVKDRRKVDLGMAVSAGSAAILLGYAVLKTFTPDWVGPVWAMEAIVLLSLANRLKVSFLRYEAWAAFAFALGAMATELAGYFMPFRVSQWGEVWLSFWLLWLALTLGWMAFVYLMPREKNFLLEWERVVRRIMDEASSVLWSVLFFAYCIPNLPRQCLILAAIPMCVLFMRAKGRLLPFTEAFALFHYTLFLLAIFMEAQKIGSMSFSSASIEAKIARVEALFFLWAIPAFYLRYIPSGRLFSQMYFMRITFWIILPLLYLPKVVLRMPEWTAIYLWCMAPIALLIQLFQKEKPLRWSFQAIVLLAMVSSLLLPFVITSIGFSFALLSLFVGIVVLVGLYLPSKGWRKEGDERWLSELGWIREGSFFYLIAVAFALCFFFTENLEQSALVSALLGICVVSSWSINAAARKALMGFWILCLLPLLLLVNLDSMIRGGDPNTYLLSGLYLVSLGVVIHRLKNFVLLTRFYGKRRVYLWAWNLILALQAQMMIRYFSAGEFDVGASLLLMVHASVILILTLKGSYRNEEKLSTLLFAVGAGKMLLLDLAHASLAQKTIVFMGLGALLLAAAYVFQNIKEKQEKKEVGEDSQKDEDRSQ